MAGTAARTYSCRIFLGFRCDDSNPAPPTPVPIDASVWPAMALSLLVVDDNETFVAAMRQFLDRSPGIALAGQAHNGADALASMALAMPDILLLDIAMPGMGGLELARIVRNRNTGVRIVFLSMHDNDAYREAARELTADFVAKADCVEILMPLLEEMVTAQESASRGSRGHDGADGKETPGDA